MNKKELETFLKRYDKYKNNNLPTPFWDDERFTLEYVYRDDNIIGDSKTKIRINYNLTEALGEIAVSGFYYPFQSKILETSFEGEKRIEKEIIGESTLEATNKDKFGDLTLVKFSSAFGNIDTGSPLKVTSSKGINTLCFENS